MIKRVINKQTKLFIRDDFTFNLVNEIGLEVVPAQGLYAPRWNGKSWEESMTLAEIEAIKGNVEVPESTLEERVTATETNVVTMQETIDAIFGGV